MEINSFGWVLGSKDDVEFIWNYGLNCSNNIEIGSQFNEDLA